MVTIDCASTLRAVSSAPFPAVNGVHSERQR
jgi:hypothetical protein